MAKLKLLSTIFSKLGSLTKNNGQIIVSRDSKSLYVDLDDERIEITDWIDINTEENLLAILTPLTNKYYYTKDNNKIWRYINNDWECLNTSVNDLTPTYTESPNLVKLSSGEKLSVAFGKISKAITDLISHISDSVKHITSAERSNWNAAKTHADSTHAPADAQKNVQSDWSATSGDAYIKNKPTEFPPSIHTHIKSEISDFPSSLPANGGNSDTVNNHTVETDVPVDAVFTDTIYDDTEVKGSIAELNSNLDGLEFSEIAGGKNLFDGKFIVGESTYAYFELPKSNVHISISDRDINVDISNIYFGLSNNVVPNYDTMIWAFVNNGTIVGRDSNDFINSSFTAKSLSIYPNDANTVTKILQRFNIQIEEGTTATQYEPYIPSVKMLTDEVNQQKNDLTDLSKLTGDKSILFNQLIPFFSSSNWVAEKNASVSFENNVATVTNTVKNFGIKTISNKKQINQNIYYFSFELKTTSKLQVDFGWGEGGGSKIYAYEDTGGVFKRFYALTKSMTHSNTPVYIWAPEGIDTFSVKNAKVVNLTKMFGAGKEPTVKEFENLFPNDCYEQTNGIPISNIGIASSIERINESLSGLSFSVSGTTLSITDGTNTWTLEAN